MYGTVARMKIRPGMRSLFLGWARHSNWTMRIMPGLVDASLYELDSDPYTIMMVVVFESREAYVANAQSAEQHAEYLNLMQFMVAEPEWNDGHVIYMG